MRAYPEVLQMSVGAVVVVDKVVVLWMIFSYNIMYMNVPSD